MDAPSLEAFKPRLDVALGSPLQWLATLHVAGGLKTPRSWWSFSTQAILSFHDMVSTILSKGRAFSSPHVITFLPKIRLFVAKIPLPRQKVGCFSPPDTTLSPETLEVFPLAKCSLSSSKMLPFLEKGRTVWEEMFVFGAENGTRGRKMSYSEAKSSIFGWKCCLLAREVGFGGGTGTECHLFCWEKKRAFVGESVIFSVETVGTVGERMS